VIPGLGSDDALVLIQGDASRDRSVDYDNLMLAIRADVADPLQRCPLGAGPRACRRPRGDRGRPAQVDDCWA
jgi:hypothetical protein